MRSEEIKNLKLAIGNGGAACSGRNTERKMPDTYRSRQIAEEKRTGVTGSGEEPELMGHHKGSGSLVFYWPEERMKALHTRFFGAGSVGEKTDLLQSPRG